MVLGNGEVVKASNQEHQDLFQGAAGAAGTLGITTLLELQLNEAKPYVEATYHPVNSTDEALQKVRDLTVQEDLDFVDGIMYSNDRGAVVSGRLVTEKPAEAKVQYFSRPWDPWFYLHVKDTIGSHETSPVIEVIPLAEYLFRYDRGGFWVGASAFKYWRFPFNRFTRWFLDDFLHTRMLYRALHASRQSQRYVVQDLALPYDTAAEFVRYTDKKFGIYPLWLCPLKQGALPTFHPHLAEMEADGVTLKPMINVGLWGFGPRNRDMFIAANRDLEHELRRLNGMKWFYAQTYYTEDEFWSIYDKEWYDNLRTKYSATRLPTVYDKVRVDIDEEKEELKKSWVPAVLKIWPFAGIWGLWKAMRSGEWKIPRKTKLAKLEVGSASVFESTE
jgi:FAD/FMN-containing dehydrogenase